MNTILNNGGPAFPVPPASALGTGDPRDGVAVVHAQEGMTLRDWFAGQALQGLLSHPEIGNTLGDEKIAAFAWAQADAMLAARAGKEGINEDPERDPNNLEGPGRTREQMIADNKALDEVAPTPADKAIMFGKTEVVIDRQPPDEVQKFFGGLDAATPETDKRTGLGFVACELIATSRRLERERDALKTEVGKWRSVTGCSSPDDASDQLCRIQGKADTLTFKVDGILAENARLREALEHVQITIRNLAADARTNRPWHPQAHENLAAVADAITEALAGKESA
jgi:hypothetical protein